MGPADAPLIGRTERSEPMGPVDALLTGSTGVIGTMDRRTFDVDPRSCPTRHPTSAAMHRFEDRRP